MEGVNKISFEHGKKLLEILDRAPQEALELIVRYRIKFMWFPAARRLRDDFGVKLETVFDKENKMAWEISIGPEAWQEIRDELDKWSEEELINAIVDDKFEVVYEKGGWKNADRAANSYRRKLQNLPHDILADKAFELIETNNTCDNGGWAYWIDRDGYHKVNLR